MSLIALLLLGATPAEIDAAQQRCADDVKACAAYHAMKTQADREDGEQREAERIRRKEARHAAARDAGLR